MTLSNESNSISYDPATPTTEFEFPFKYFESSDILVIITDSAGVITELLNTEYSVLATNGDSDLGATVTTVASYTSGDNVKLERVVPYTQQYDLKDGASIDATALNNAFDRVVAQNQQQNDNINENEGLARDALGRIGVKVDDLTIGFTGSGDIEVKDDGITTSKILSGAVTTAKIDDAAVTTTQIATQGVWAVNINTDAVTNAKMADNSVDSDNIQPDAVTTAKILDLNVTRDKLATDSVSEDKISVGAVGTDEIKDLNVTSGKLAGFSVLEGKLASDAVTTDKILNANVTHLKLADNSVFANNILDGQVGSDEIASFAITTGKIASSAVDTGQIAAFAVTEAKIESDAVTASKIAATSVLEEKLASNVRYVPHYITMTSHPTGLSQSRIGTGTETHTYAVSTFVGSAYSSAYAYEFVVEAKITTDDGVAKIEYEDPDGNFIEGLYFDALSASAVATGVVFIIPVNSGQVDFDIRITNTSGTSVTSEFEIKATRQRNHGA